MAGIIHSDWYWYANKGWRINSKKSGLRIDILKCLLSQLNAMLERDSKIFMFRFELHVPDYTSNNRCITNFNRRLFKRIKHHYKSQIGYVWAREHERAKNKKQHYHYVIFLEGHKVRSPIIIQKWIREIWRDYDGTPHWSRYKNFHRSDEVELQKSAYWISYLAKPRGKGKRPAQTKDYGSSRLKSARPT